MPYFFWCESFGLNCEFIRREYGFLINLKKSFMRPFIHQSQILADGKVKGIFSYA